MKIYAISDLHGQLEGLDPRGADLVLVAGDFAPIPLIGPDDHETTVRNVSRLDEDYRIRYEPFVFEL